MDKKSEEYLRQYIKLTDTIKQKIEAHARSYERFLQRAWINLSI